MATKEAVLPIALEKGDTVAFISPSSRLNDLFAHRVETAKHFFETAGFQIQIIYHSRLPETHLEAIHQRCEEIHSAFSNRNIKAIICTIGGISANEVLPHLDYGLIRMNPKIFCGYSDVTILHGAFFTQSGLRTFYGPGAITEFGEAPQPLRFTSEQFFGVVMGEVRKEGVSRSLTHVMEFRDWLGGEGDVGPRELIASPGWKWLRGGKAEGRLFGGCLPSLVQLCGTKFSPDYTGRVLLVELPEGDGPGKPYSLDTARSCFADLRNAGVLEVISGLVVGRPYMYDGKTTEVFEKMLVDQCYGLEFPILAGVDAGHSDPMLTLPLDAMVLLDSDGVEAEQFVILEEVVAKL